MLIESHSKDNYRSQVPTGVQTGCNDIRNYKEIILGAIYHVEAGPHKHAKHVLLSNQTTILLTNLPLWRKAVRSYKDKKDTSNKVSLVCSSLFDNFNNMIHDTIYNFGIDQIKTSMTSLLYMPREGCPTRSSGDC